MGRFVAKLHFKPGVKVTFVTSEVYVEQFLEL